MAIRTTPRCRWTTSCGQSSATTRPGSSTPASARSTRTRRNRRLLRTAAEALATIGVDARAVTDVILTHAHYDHAGGLDHFPIARFHVQEREMAFATGRPMTEPGQSHGFTADHVAALVHHVHAGRVVFHDGDEEVAPGLSLHLLGGHTDGMQVVRVETGSGAVVLASDSTHYYENFETGRPFPIVYDVDAMVDGWATLRRLASDDDAIVPGHDPLVLRALPGCGARPRRHRGQARHRPLLNPRSVLAEMFHDDLRQEIQWSVRPACLLSSRATAPRRARRPLARTSLRRCSPSRTRSRGWRPRVPRPRRRPRCRTAIRELRSRPAACR